MKTSFRAPTALGFSEKSELWRYSKCCPLKNKETDGGGDSENVVELNYRTIQQKRKMLQLSHKNPSDSSIALSQDISNTKVTGKPQLQSKAMVSTSNMADDEWLQVHADRDELQRWLKARSLETGQKQELIDRVIKANEDGTEKIEERETREKKVRETRAAEKLRSPSENLPDPKTLKNWTNDLLKLPQISYKEIIDYLVYGSCKFFQRK